MKRITLVVGLLSLAGCNFAVKHPAATAGIVAGSIGFGTCELAAEDHKNCALAGGAVGLGLGLIAATALWLGSEEEAPAKQDPPPKIDWSKVPDTTPKQPTQAPPPVSGAPPPSPPAPDAGVPDAPLEPTTQSDAGAPAVDAQ